MLDPGNVVMVHFYHGADAWGLDAPTYFPEQAFGGSRKLAKAWRAVQKLAGIESLFGDPFMAASLMNFLRQNGVTAVFSQYLVAGATVQDVVARLGLRHVVRGHGYDLSSSLEQDQWKRRYQVLESADSIVVPTEYQTARLRAIGLNSVPIHAYPYGVDLSPDRPESHESEHQVRIVTAGRMVAKKGPLLALKAFLIAAERCPDIVLTMVGDGPMLGQVRELCEQHPLGKRVTLVGALPHAKTLEAIGKAAIFLQHSLSDPITGDQEGAPVAILEAMARSVPVVSTRHSGIPYLVREGVAGLLSEEGDVVAMAENLLSLATNHDMRRRMSVEASKHAQNFTWEIERSVLLQLLYKTTHISA
ncbi:glycosyltransferase family 4 protein [Cyanobium sp. ATX 6A2]|uniref:glycosyltransferase family 4 protein n=1 Tax=Cyanobium sp. ATX 6A2 TaxID=2823700 RepID=UPI0020CD316D|nr:glycosyltransferase family 4 protein [Cyanobium sp. ATX 6A2]MCP9888699.1 glycosyltransferase family 4 protein [Cyanobium sp. ATX 6A2]